MTPPDSDAREVVMQATDAGWNPWRLLSDAEFIIRDLSPDHDFPGRIREAREQHRKQLAAVPDSVPLPLPLAQRILAALNEAGFGVLDKETARLVAAELRAVIGK